MKNNMIIALMYLLNRQHVAMKSKDISELSRLNLEFYTSETVCDL